MRRSSRKLAKNSRVPMMAFAALLWGVLFSPLALANSDTPFVLKKGRPGLIVFVHGFHGNAATTWLNEETENYWPNLMAIDDHNFGQFDIYTVRYGSKQNLEELTTQLLSELQPLFQEYQYLVLITHSMGGLIAKNMLIKLNTSTKVDQLQKVKAVIYMGTPAQGADAAWWAQYIKWEPQIKDLLPGNKNALLQSIDNNWEQLIRERNQSGRNSPKSFCAYETVALHNTIILVDRTAAKTHCDTDMQGFPFDHVQIVKPKSESDTRYTWTRDRIQEAVPRTVAETSGCAGAAMEEYPRVRVSVFKHGGSSEAFGQVMGLIKDRLITIREKLSDSKDEARQYLSMLTDCPIDDSLPADEQAREQWWNKTYSLELIDGVVFQQGTGGARARSRIYLGSLGGQVKDVPLDIRVTPESFGTLRDIYSLTTIYALLMDAKRLRKPPPLRLHYLHTAIALAKDLNPATDAVKQLQQALEQEAKVLKALK